MKPAVLYTYSMRVLILDTDLFISLGGGQSSYQKIIQANPNIQFFYILQNESLASPRPANTSPIQYRHSIKCDRRLVQEPVDHLFNHFEEAINIAKSVAEAIGPVFLDVVDTPDYQFRGLFIRAALRAFGVDVGKIAIAMHGTITVSVKNLWPATSMDSRLVAQFRLFESLQYQTVDIRYALSEMYAEYWARRTRIKPNMIDPLVLIEPAVPIMASRTTGAPDLVFVGRLERRKGPDIFLDLAWCLDESSYRHIDIIGPEHVEASGVSSTTILSGIAQERGLPIRLLGPRTQAELDTVFRDRTVLVVPSRYDTFNLVALEALRVGCPVFMTKDMGIARWITTHYPELSDLILDIDCSRHAYLQIEYALTYYDTLRQKIVDIFKKRPLVADFASLTRVYGGDPVFHLTARQALNDHFNLFINFLEDAGSSNAFRDKKQAAQHTSSEAQPNTDVEVVSSVPSKPPNVDAIADAEPIVAAQTLQKTIKLLRNSGLFNSDYYISNHPTLEISKIDPIAHFLEIGSRQYINPHPLFDIAFYCKNNPDVIGVGINPLVHYLKHGGREGRDPHPLFKTKYYLNQIDAESAPPENPLLHFLTKGASEGLVPNPLFDIRFYREQLGDVSASAVNPLVHYVTEGGLAGIDPHPLFSTLHYRSQVASKTESVDNPLVHFLQKGAADGLTPHPLFDVEYYLQSLPAFTVQVENPLTHYLEFGGIEQRNPHPLFDQTYYLDNNPDVALAGLNPLLHYIRYGARERRDPHPLFSSEYYSSQVGQGAETIENLLIHFLSKGSLKRLAPHPLFDIGYYLDKNLDVAQSKLNPIVHYLRYGYREFRNPHPLFDTRFYLHHAPDVAAVDANPLVHYVLFGGRERRDIHPLFKSKWYLSQLSIHDRDVGNPLRHYLTNHAADRISPHPIFDGDWYRQQAGLSEDHAPLVHYLSKGAVMGLSPHPLFDGSWYVRVNNNVASTGVNPLLHYLEHGAAEGRAPAPNFLIDGYLLERKENPTLDENPILEADQTIRSAFEREPSADDVMDPDTARTLRHRSFELIRYAGARVPSLGFHLNDGERAVIEISNKLGAIGARLSEYRFGRIAIYRNMARLARKNGADLVAATYCLRVMRLAGTDKFADLPFVVDTLQRHKFAIEAETASAMFGSPADSVQRCRAILENQAKIHLTKPDLPLATFDDRRGGSGPKVSIIVSLYKAESKLLTLLDNLSLQTLAQNGNVEIVLVDSNSPTNEYNVFRSFAANHDIPLVYARSHDRETIQAAWNRGIKMSRAPYLCFIGADEGLHPQALAILSSTLDSNPTIDWVIGDSMITNVDRNGLFVNDIMPYDRTGYQHSSTRLDTCYLNYVGGLYRRSIHDRFGYYDEGFRGAGDTEFKLRLLPHITSAYVPKMLGVFNNYPEERMTASPLAEIEDLRAWYLHRTAGGMAYGFDNKPIEEVEDLFRLSLGYRKSYFKHTSTDFDLASSIAKYMKTRSDSGDFGLEAERSANRLLGLVRSVDSLGLTLPVTDRWRVVCELKVAAHRFEAADQQTFGLAERPKFDFFNDNRYEQHWWAWN